MKKFSNIDEKTNILKEQKSKINKLVDILIRENLHVSYDGDLGNDITKKFTIEGSDNLVNKLNDLIERHVTESNDVLIESIKYKYGNQLDQIGINKEIKLLENYLHIDIIPSPYDIFSLEDAMNESMSDDMLVLKSLNNIPTDYMDYVNLQESKKFFENGNTIRLRYAGPMNGWELNFECNYNNYGTSIESKDDKYKHFLIENKQFIANFLEATSTLIGASFLSLNKSFVQI